VLSNHYTTYIKTYFISGYVISQFPAIKSAKSAYEIPKFKIRISWKDF